MLVAKGVWIWRLWIVVCASSLSFSFAIEALGGEDAG